MELEEIVDRLSAYDEVVVQRLGPDDRVPELAWGDVFFYFAPDDAPPSGQPFATIITKDYPDEPAWHAPGSFRVNIAVGTERFRDLLGRDPRDPTPATEDSTARDVLAAHPAYGQLGWVCVVEPGERTSDVVGDLLDAAYAAARRRHERRHAPGA